MREPSRNRPQGLWRFDAGFGPAPSIPESAPGLPHYSGSKLQAPAGLLGLFENFLSWEPVPPRSAKDLAHTAARLCRLLRAEVTEQLGLGSEALTGLAADWRKLLFPDATDERFADGYAQAVTFGMLMARVKNIRLATGLQQVAAELSHTSTLIGAALRLLTDNAENQENAQNFAWNADARAGRS